MSDQDNHCCCSHEHETGCGNHDTDCGQNSACSGGCCQDSVIYITEEEHAFLMKLAQLPFLPLTRFVMRSTTNDDATAVALAPVYMTDKTASMDEVKKTGEILQSLEDKFMITLDYDMPLQNGDYAVYEESALYRFFCSTVQEGGKQAGFLFDQPILERGSIALTTLGQDAVDSLQ